MSVTATASSIGYDGNDVATDFAVPFKFIETNDLKVEISTDAGVTWLTQLEGSFYIVDGADEDAGGTVTTDDPVPTGTKLRITRNTDITQDTDFTPQGAFPAVRHENAFDKLTLICQELARRVAALESLGSLVNVTDIATAVYAGDDLAIPGEVEAAFPFTIPLANGANAKFIVATITDDDGSTVFEEPPQLQWDPGPGNEITVRYISGLSGGGTLYHYHFLVFF